jgi:GntR family transcriptional regulator/MocR family aminotransferase
MWSILAASSLAVDGDGALFVRIADAVVRDIRRGALRAGDRLPSTRAIASDLRVNRNTVVAAFDELIAQGWIEADGARGTRVSADVPPITPLDRSSGSSRPLGSSLPSASSRSSDASHSLGIAGAPGFALREVGIATTPFGNEPAEFHVSIGVPDTRLVPHALIARAYRRALQSRGARANLDYGSAYGTTRLREAIAVYLRGRGLAVGIDNVMITRGSQMAIDLAARAVLRPGEIAAVEELGYQPAWRALEEAGAKLAGVPLDESGLVVDEVPAKARIVYTTPHHQYPTTVLLSPARRLALLARARERGIAIIEDDYDHEFHFEGRPVPPLAAMDPTNVIYVGTLSKILAPGLRLGFVAAHATVIDRLARLRMVVDRQGDHVLESAIAELIEEGAIARHARKMRRVYAERRDALASALDRELRGVLSFALPAGGITLWARVADGIAIDRWKQRALEAGVAVAFAKDFALDRTARPYVRLGFAHLTPKELSEIARRLRRSLPKLTSR